MALSAKEISDIVKICRKNKVSKFSIGDVTIEFSNFEKKERKIHVDQKEIEETSKKANSEESINTAEEDLSQLMVTDPSEYEYVMERILNETGRA
jgi:hypothetical protein